MLTTLSHHGLAQLYSFSDTRNHPMFKCYTGEYHGSGPVEPRVRLHCRRRYGLLIRPSDTDTDFYLCEGGTAGNVVANRLSEDPDRSVLVLEAGGS
jgi:hypothetical protein